MSVILRPTRPEGTVSLKMLNEDLKYVCTFYLLCVTDKGPPAGLYCEVTPWRNVGVGLMKATGRSNTRNGTEDVILEGIEKQRKKKKKTV
jgi:hypothetical protein